MLACTAFGLNGSTPPAHQTCAAPNQSAMRSNVPKFPGSETPSSAKMNRPEPGMCSAVGAGMRTTASTSFPLCNVPMRSMSCMGRMVAELRFPCACAWLSLGRRPKSCAASAVAKSSSTSKDEAKSSITSFRPCTRNRPCCSRSFLRCKARTRFNWGLPLIFAGITSRAAARFSVNCGTK